MTPMHFAFRKLLLKNIPNLTSEDLDRYDSLLALRLQYIHQAQLDELPPDQPVDDDTGEFAIPKREFGELKSDPAAQKPPQTAHARQLRPLVELIKITSDAAQNVIAPHRRRFEALHRLWIARRQLAVHSGNLLQIPTTFTTLRQLLKAGVNYLIVQVTTFVVLAVERIRDFFTDRRKLLFFCVLVLVAICIWLILARPQPGRLI